MNLQWSGGTAATLCESELSVIVIMSYLQGFTGKKKKKHGNYGNFNMVSMQL